MTTVSNLVAGIRYGPFGMTALEVLFLWLGIVAVWAAASVLFLGTMTTGPTGVEGAVATGRGGRVRRFGLLGPGQRIVVVVAWGLVLVACGLYLTGWTSGAAVRV